ncbi:membrane protein [Dictyobacter alpinus]|uniref:Membrane protein n=1 Tax=Dictyobacter alpinus TaxID=2014873 RepID=A0A402B926_9CHLR|nr:PspA/IM30 family protein [Dictyobacter alpinus]GCE27812.1 membrane protein [Dictyobacter alpinus]
MNLFERALTLLRANLDTVAEKAEDPEKALRQLQLDMRNQLVQVKTEVAKAIAEGHVLQKRIQARKTETDSWLKKAEMAVQQNNDAAARKALTQYNEGQKVVQRYQKQKQEQEQLVSTMRNLLHKLEAKIAEVDTTIELLATRKRNAIIQQRVYEALQKTSAAGANSAHTNASETLLDAEARAQALADLNRRTLANQLDALSAEQTVENQLNTIKYQQQERANSKERTPKTGPLHSASSSEETTTRRRIKINPRNTSKAEDTSTEKDLDLEYLKKLLEASQNPE